MKKAFLILSMAMMLVSCQQPKQENPVLTVEGGQITGVINEAGDVISYKGIPYAAQPVGDLRWKKPQPVEPWQGVKECNEFGNASFQQWPEADSFTGKEFYYEGKKPMGEDCLYLNVWTPKDAAGDTKANLPVAFYIHGGGFTIGLSNHCALDGEFWAQKDVVTVLINYRLGHMGFFCHPLLSQEDPDGVSGNYGLYDQLAALRWVRENIQQFGGDPDNITVFGQSAGAMSVKDLLISPLTDGMIAKAIMQSGGGIGSPLGGSSASRNDSIGKVMMDLGGYTTLEQIRKVSYDEMVSLADRLKQETGLSAVTSPYADGVIMTGSVYDAIQDRSIKDIPYIIGATADDMPFGKGEVLNEFCREINRIGSHKIYQYEFARRLPGDDSGAFHGSDLWFTFHTVGRNWRPWTEADYALSEKMVTLWTNFAKYGNPDGDGAADGIWPAWSDENPFILKLDVE